MQQLRLRVQVKGGDGQQNLGLGWLVGNEAVYVIKDVRGGQLCLRSEADPTIPPNISDLPEGCTVESIGDNPRIDLDSGRTVYGCQVWWEFANDGDEKVYNAYTWKRVAELKKKR